MADKKGRRALGRGLDALLPQTVSAAPPRGVGQLTCAIERIVPRRDQPRQQYDSAALDELAQTIREHGVIQPLIVRKVAGAAEQYEIIAGERRWRASQRAGLKDVPIVVKDVSPEDAFEMALVENLQRQDLNPLEVAEGYQRLIDEHGHTQEALAERMGKSRVAVTNALRLLKLPAQVRAMLNEGALSEGHGRAILGAPDERAMVTLARKAARDKLSVRKIEQLIRSSRKRDGAAPLATHDSNAKSAAIRDLEARLTRAVGSKVAVDHGRHGGKGGQVVIRYADLDELDRIIAAIGA
jgi:ParB family chromosome partitioning protein